MIAPAEVADVPEVIALIRDTLAEFGVVFGEGSSTDAELHGLPGAYVERGGMFWIAREGDALLGTCGVFPLGAGVFELRKMYLRPAARGLGLGRQLLDTAVGWARAQGGTHLVLDTMEAMQGAIAFYEAHGFTRDDAQVRGSRCTRGYVRLL